MPRNSQRARRFALGSIVTALILTACESATDRCRRISSEEWRNRLYEQTEADFWERVGGHPRYNPRAPHEDQLQVQREVRAQMATETRRHSPDNSRELDSLRKQLGKPYGAARDSMDPEKEPPPKPSDLRWYNEHCYKGEPR